MSSKQNPLWNVKCDECGLPWKSHGSATFHCPKLDGERHTGFLSTYFTAIEIEGLVSNTRFEGIE